MRTIITIIFIGLVYVTLAQNYVPNQLIVQLESKKSIDKSIEQAQVFLPEAEFIMLQPLSKSLNIWLVGYNETNVTSENAVATIERVSSVALAQVNHTGIKNRNQPNDAEYGQQWCHFNSNDADMDTEEAWDITTGGVTALGDTIVVAVIDGGADLTHEDLNYWRNYQEIEAN